MHWSDVDQKTNSSESKTQMCLALPPQGDGGMGAVGGGVKGEFR